MIILLVSLRRVAPNTSEQRSRSGLCKRVIRREATETEGLVKDKDSFDSTFWRCEKRDLCNGCITTHRISGCIKNPPSTHTHSPDSAAIEAVKTIGDIKLRSALTEEPTSSVIQNSTKSMSIPAAVNLPSKNSLSKIVRRKRRAPDEDFFEKKF